MNELHKYATFSVDLLGKPNKINNLFSTGRARIFYKGINRNRSIIDGEVAEKLALTIPGTPVIGTYNYETNDFEGHEDNPSAYGFIPLDPKSTWTKIKDSDGKEREYLEVDVVIWDGYFEEAQSILSENKHLSMELNPRTLRGTFEKIGDTTYYRMTYAEFAGITVLGDDTEPCFKDAQFLTVFSNMVSEYALYVNNKQENIEGGKDIMDNINEIVEPEVTTETVVEEVTTEETISAEEITETPVLENEPEVEEEAEVENTESEVIAEESESEIEFACGDKKSQCAKCGEEKSKCACGDKKSQCAKCGEDKAKCACGNKKANNEKCGNEPCDDIEDESDDREDDEFKCNKKDYEALIAELEETKSNYSALEEKYNEALNSLNKYTKKEKLEIISKFSTKLESEELIEKLTNEVDNYTLEEIKSELGQALVEQLSAEDVAEEPNKETNFSLNINLNDNSLGNSAWDLVKRHKESK